DVESLRRLKEQLAPGGRLVMTVPALPWLWSRHDETHHHFRRYTRGGLEAALVLAGLKPVKISYFNTLLFPLIAGLRLIRKAIGFEGADDDAMPHPAANEILKRIFGFESHLVGRIPLPLGVSLLAVAERPL
ncbi:MAG TPA: class I SAM-dependent methyltransferase, partial [Kiloniellales bacterium]